MKIGLVSLGCCKNLVDSQNALSFLKASGHTFVSDPKKAEVIVVNTCGFINDAKQESIDTILQMADYKRNKLKYLIVMGCLVQRYRKELEKELPEVDLFVSIDEYKDMEAIFNHFLGSETVCGKEVVLATSANSAYLRIADGCSNKCAYCAIPLIRKDYRSVPFEDVLAQAKELEKLGIAELNLIAQDTTRYGIDLYNRYRLGDLLKQLDRMNFRWIRILYMYPDEISDELLQVMSECEHVLPYFDIPVQHGNDRMLALMNRRGNRQHILQTIAKIRERFKEPVIRTTMIVGFPSETEEEFDEMLDFVREVRFSKLGAFTYSAEEDTTSYEMEPKVEEEVMERRLEKLMEVQSEIELKNNRRYVNCTLDVLVEYSDALDKTLYQGRAACHAPDDIDGHIRIISTQPLSIGQFVKVVVDEAGQHDLFGHAVI